MKKTKLVAIKWVSINQGHFSYLDEICDSPNTEIIINNKTFFEIALINLKTINNIDEIFVFCYDYSNPILDNDNNYNTISNICHKYNVKIKRIDIKKWSKYGCSSEGKKYHDESLYEFINKNIIHLNDWNFLMDYSLLKNIINYYYEIESEFMSIRLPSVYYCSINYWQGKYSYKNYVCLDNKHNFKNKKIIKASYHVFYNYLNLLYKKQDIKTIKDFFKYTNNEIVIYDKYFEYCLKNIKNIIKFPQNIIIALTNECYHYCIYCPKNVLKRKSTKMSFELFKKIIDEKLLYFPDDKMKIEFSGYGEPLLNTNIFKMIDYANKRIRNIEIDLYTNGELLTLENFKKLAKGGVTNIFVSIDAVTKETYFKIHNKNVYDIVVQNLNTISKYKKDNNIRIPRLIPNFIICEENNEEAIDFIKKYGVRNQIEKSNKNVNIEDELYSGKYECYDYAVIRGVNNYSGQMPQNKKITDYTPIERDCCKQFYNSIYILSNGDVTICRQDYKARYKIGSLNDQKLIEIIRNEEYINLINLHENLSFENHDLCLNCKEWYNVYD